MGISRYALNSESASGLRSWSETWNPSVVAVHHHVQNDQVRLDRLDLIQSICPVGSRKDLVSGRFQRHLSGKNHIGVIVDDKNFRHAVYLNTLLGDVYFIQYRLGDCR